jgi:hypothetical protein
MAPNTRHPDHVSAANTRRDLVGITRYLFNAPCHYRFENEPHFSSNSPPFPNSLGRGGLLGRLLPVPTMVLIKAHL